MYTDGLFQSYFVLDDPDLFKLRQRVSVGLIEANFRTTKSPAGGMSPNRTKKTGNDEREPTLSERLMVSQEPRKEAM